MSRKVMGYLTVEASLIMPFVVMVYVWILGMLFYQYDRVLLEQDAVMLLVTNAGEQSMDTSKYMWCDVKSPMITEGGWKQTVILEADCTGPYFKELSTQCSRYVINPVALLRQKRKLDNWMEKKENG